MVITSISWDVTPITMDYGYSRRFATANARTASVELILSDEQVQEHLRDHLHEFESPTSAKHLVGVVEFQGQSGLITLYGDGHVHRQGLQDYAETVERDGRNEYVYSTGYVALVELPHHELITTCIDNRLTLLRPVPELPDVNAVRCCALIVTNSFLFFQVHLMFIR